MSDGGLVHWDEPEPGGCYIPWPREKRRERSADVLAEVARRYGDGMVQFAEGGEVQ